MGKKNVISKTVLFFSIMIFISIFKLVFGNENALVGIGIITSALVLLERDLTVSPLENLIKLLGINVLLGIFAFLANNNIWLGIVLNFLALFSIGYLFSYNFRKSIVMPFGLQYLFMLYTPVYGVAFSNRILGLIFGAFLIMAMQYLFNKDKVSKTGTKTLDNIFQNILLKINLLKKDSDLANVDEEIESSINDMKKIVYDIRVKKFYITRDGKIITNILFYLERINILLDKLKEESKKISYLRLLNDIYNKLESIKNKNLNLEELYIMEFKYEKSDLNMIYLRELINLMESLYNELLEISTLDKKERNYIDNKIDIPKHFCKFKIQKRNFNTNSLKFSYGIRLGVVGALTAFITHYFHLAQGRWMVYTVFSLIQPYSEHCKTKAKQRIEGTIIGAVIVFILFTLIENTVARYGIILLAGYLNPFAKEYRNLVVCITISAVASLALFNNTNIFILDRIVFVIFGTIIALLANKYILPYKIKDENAYLIKIYNSVVSQMRIEVKSNNIEHSIKNLFLIPAFIEERMNLIKFGITCDKEREFIYNQRILVNDIYNYYLLPNKNNKDNIINTEKTHCF